MNNKIKVLLSLLGVVVLIVGLLWVTGKITSMTGKVIKDVNSDFYDCIADSAVLYVREGCGACAKQKEILGDNLDRINYIDCAVSRQECVDAGIEYVPTWIVDDEKKVGVLSIDEIKLFSNCN